MANLAYHPATIAAARGRGGPARMDDGMEGRVDRKEESREARPEGQSILLPLLVGAVFLIVLVLGAMAG